MAKSIVSILYTTDSVELAIKDGVATTGNSRGFISVGVDGSGNAQFVLVDTSGRQQVVGAAATGAALAGNPVLLGASDGTNVQVPRLFDVDPGAGTEFVFGITLRKAVSGGSVELGTSADPIRTDPTGTTTQPVSGTVTATQGTAAAATAPWAVRLSDGTNFYDGTKTGQLPTSLVGGRLDINAGAWFGSTAPTVGQKAMASSLPVVIASDQSPIPVSVTGGVDRTSTGTISTIENIAVSTQGSGSCGVQISGTWTGTIVFEATVDGTTWNAVNAEVPTLGTEVTFTVANGVWIIACAGYSQVRARGNTVATGTASVFLESSTATQVVILGDPLPTGSNVIGAVTQSGPWTVTGHQGNAGSHAQRWMIGLSDGSGFISPATDRTTAAAPFSFRLSDGSAFYDAAKTGQLPTSLVGGRLDVNAGSWFGSTAPTVGQKTMVDSIPIVFASDQSVLPVSQNGTWTVQQGTPPWQVVGPGAVGAAVTGNPVIMGGSDGTNAQYVSVDTSGRLVIVQPTASLLNATVTQGPAAALSGYWPVRVTDGTNTLPTMDVAARSAFVRWTDGTNTAAVKPASTAAVAGDPAGVVAFSPNSPLPAGSNVVGGVTQSGTWAVQQGTPPWAVKGTDADGAAPTQSPVLVAGQDGTNVQTLKTDATGRSEVVGAAADGAAPSGAPVLTAGQDGTNVQSFKTDTTGRQEVIGGAADGATLAGNPVLVAAKEAGNATTLRTVAGRLDENIGSWFGATTPTVGQKAMAESIPVCLPTDQTAVLVTFTGTRTGVVSSIITLGGGTAGMLQVMRSTTYNEQGANAKRSFASSSASDTAAGTGARKVHFTYYTTTGTGPFEETVTLSGTTAVPTVATDIRFIESMEVTEVGSGGANVGTITMYVNDTGGGGTIGTIGIGNILTAVGDNRTLWAHHYVETGVIASLSTLIVGAQSGGSGTSARFFVRKQAVLVANSAEELVGDILLTQGAFSRLFNFYVRVPGFARLTAYAIPAVNNSTLSAAFDFSET